MKTQLSIHFYIKPLASSPLSLIYMRIIVNRKKSELTTGFRVESKFWDESKQRIDYRCNYSSYNSHLAALENRINEIVLDLERHERIISSTIIKKMITGKDKIITQLSEYIDYWLTTLEQSQEHANSTKKDYRRRLNYVKLFLDHQNTPYLKVTQVDFRFLQEFDLWLQNYISKQTNLLFKRSYINKLHKTFKSLLINAENEELIKRQPYKGKFKIKEERSISRDYLTQDEVKIIQNHSLMGDATLCKIREIFLFSCYTGLRFSDAISLRIDQIQIDNFDRAWIHINQIKTGESVTIPLFAPAKLYYESRKDLIEVKESGLLLPKITNQSVNKYLKVIQSICQISKRLTHHVARHTFGTMLADQHTSFEDIAKLMGHRSQKSSRIYARITEGRLGVIANNIDKKLYENDI